MNSWRIRRNVTISMVCATTCVSLRADIGNGLPFPTDMTEAQFWVRLIEGDLRGTNYQPVPTDKKTMVTAHRPFVGSAW